MFWSQERPSIPQNSGSNLTYLGSSFATFRFSPGIQTTAPHSAEFHKKTTTKTESSNESQRGCCTPQWHETESLHWMRQSQAEMRLDLAGVLEMHEQGHELLLCMYFIDPNRFELTISGRWRHRSYRAASDPVRWARSSPSLACHTVHPTTRNNHATRIWGLLLITILLLSLSAIDCH